jgi:hypothetical protein
MPQNEAIPTAPDSLRTPPLYNLAADGITHSLWCFANHALVFFIIDRSRGSPVINWVRGNLFNGILISDFFNAYNCIQAMAKQKISVISYPIWLDQTVALKVLNGRAFVLP